MNAIPKQHSRIGSCQLLEDFIAEKKSPRDNGGVTAKKTKLLGENSNNPSVKVSYSSEEVPALAAFGSAQELNATLAAVVELRRQYRAEPVTRKQPFPGARALLKAGVDTSRTPDSPGPAYRFMREQYGAEIDTGRLGPADLRDLDQALCNAVGYEAEGQGRKVGDYLKAGSQEAVYSRKRQAISTIIGAPYEELSSFLSFVRDRRHLQPQKGGSAGR